jgi:hypothetical protein
MLYILWHHSSGGGGVVSASCAVLKLNIGWKKVKVGALYWNQTSDGRNWKWVRHITSTSTWMVSPYTQHINTQLHLDGVTIYTAYQHNSAQIILLIFYILAYILKFNLKYTIIYTCKLNYFDVICNISFKGHLPEDGHNR